MLLFSLIMSGSEVLRKPSAEMLDLARVLKPETNVCRMMLVGLGGNNGTTIMGGIIANKQCASSYHQFYLPS